MDKHHLECVSVLNCILTGGTAKYKRGRNTEVPITLKDVMSVPLTELFEQWRDKVIFTHREVKLHDRTLYGVQVGDVWLDDNGVPRTVSFVFNHGGVFRDFNKSESQTKCLVHLMYRKGLRE